MREPQEGDERDPDESDVVGKREASHEEGAPLPSDSMPDPQADDERATSTLIYDPLAGIRASVAQMQIPLAQMVAADPLAGIRASVAQMQTPLAQMVAADPLAGIRASVAQMQTPLSALLRGLAEQAQNAFPHHLLQQLTKAKRLLAPENLRHLRPTLWPWLLRISAKDGVCLGWAPRAEIVSALLVMRTSQERHQLLLNHRKEVVDDSAESLREVDHPELLQYVKLAEEAAMCIRDNRDAAAQALLGNVLDSCMREHGHNWLTEHFTNAQFLGSGSHKMVSGALATQAQIPFLRPAMLGPYLLVASLKNAFAGSPRQSTFNRHLGAHKAAMGNYRSEFALGALLVTQALLRQIDGHLWAQS
ncbi:hypothetical protein ACIQ6K_40665 [Streptomyces sp. NPDC096354]|uniref:hypothetical protein n=1 Tax=Streptomyces sp. NPDC096354 TaxID=3366088 RepID=UPI003821D4B0